MSKETSESPIRVSLQPLGKTVEVPAGTALQDALFPLGVEFPCGGRGACKGCRLRVLEGRLPVTPLDERAFDASAIEQGWRLACQARADEDVVLQLAQWDVQILTDDTPFAFEPREGLGVAVDVGTTTVVAQLLDLTSGRVLAVRTGLNPQARHGSDIMSRVDFAVNDDGQEKLQSLIRADVGRLINEAAKAADVSLEQLERVVIVGNTVMHHLFCGCDVGPLSRYPFESPDLGLQVMDPAALGWSGTGARVEFLPAMGGFVGSDVLAGVLATRLYESEAIEALVDLGTNGEIVLGNRDGLHCAATAAGPAFEGARISMGMRAATGAISAVRAIDGKLACSVIGDGAPRGLCGSGLVAAVASSLDLGWILSSGRLSNGGDSLVLAEPVTLSQTDVRQLQLAKGAVAAGIRILAERCGIDPGSISRLHLAGAFGNYIDIGSARRIGLLPVEESSIRPAGNTALLGAKLALFGGDVSALTDRIIGMTEHMTLSADPEFQDKYVDEMLYPECPGRR